MFTYKTQIRLHDTDAAGILFFAQQFEIIHDAYAPTLPKDHLIVMNMCGRGDKDIFTVAKHLGVEVKV